MSEKAEHRIFNITEVEERADKMPVIKGYAAVFDAETKIAGVFREKIARGAFKRALKEKQDVRALVNHDANLLVGRSKSGTLKMKEDEKGLSVEIEPPNTNAGRDLVESMKRGDLDQMSFAFVVRKQKWIDRGIDNNEEPVRIIEDVDLYDVSVVTYPAYQQTEAQLRTDAERVMKEHEAESSPKEEFDELSILDLALTEAEI